MRRDGDDATQRLCRSERSSCPDRYRSSYQVKDQFSSCLKETRKSSGGGGGCSGSSSVVPYDKCCHDKVDE